MDPRSDIHLIVSDIEGCITPSDRGIINLDDLAPIAEYCAAAKDNDSLPPFVFCTGRQIPYVESIGQIIGAFFPGLPSIVENGAYLYDLAANDIKPNPLLTADVLEMIRQVQGETDGIIRQHGAKREYGKEASISLNPPPDMTIEELFKITQTMLSHCFGMIEVSHSQSAVDITPTGVNKATGLRYLAELTGIAPTKMLGIGDTRGDMQMLELVGIPTCPQNATEDVRKISKFIAPSDGALGVVEILREFTAWK